MEKCHNCGARIVDADNFCDWEALCPQCGNLTWLAPGDVVLCTVERLTEYGIFVELGDRIRGMIHITELSAGRIEHPAEVVSVGDQIHAKVLRVEIADRQIGMSMKRAGDGLERDHAD
jgi:small subunit ribosomal protein S1